jgi:soluble lytic murein transglycosylase-like protein
VNPAALLLGLGIVVAMILSPRPADAPGVPRKRVGPTIRSLPGTVFTKPAKGAIPEIVNELAEKWGSVFGVSKTWIRSQAYAESKNVPTVINAVTNAMGLMQILPRTAEWLVHGLKKSRFWSNTEVRKTLTGGANLLDPSLNVMLAAYYLAVLKKKFGDDHDLVAAAYNIGPTRIAYNLKNGLPLPAKSMLYLALVKDAQARGFV